MQITALVSGFALDSCTGTVILRGNGFAPGTSSARDAVVLLRTRYFVLSSRRRKNQTRIFASGHNAALRERFIFRISRRLTLWRFTHDYTEFCNTRGDWITALRTATTARGVIFSVIARDASLLVIGKGDRAFYGLAREALATRIVDYRLKGDEAGQRLMQARSAVITGRNLNSIVKAVKRCSTLQLDTCRNSDITLRAGNKLRHRQWITRIGGGGGVKSRR